LTEVLEPIINEAAEDLGGFDFFRSKLT
jgi:hypothetical protein